MSRRAPQTSTPTRLSDADLGDVVSLLAPLVLSGTLILDKGHLLQVTGRDRAPAMILVRFNVEGVFAGPVFALGNAPCELVARGGSKVADGSMVVDPQGAA